MFCTQISYKSLLLQFKIIKHPVPCVYTQPSTEDDLSVSEHVEDIKN